MRNHVFYPDPEKYRQRSIPCRVVGGLAIGYAKLGQMVFKGPLPRLDLTPRDAGMVVLDLSAAMATKDMLIKQGLIPSDIVK